MQTEDDDGGRVLVVDDDPQVRKITEMMLTQFGFEVVSAESGEQAIARADEEDGAVDLVLMDLTMPGLSGPQAFVEMRRAHPQLKVLFTSGYQEEESPELSRGEGVVGFLQKPFELEALVEQVRRGMGRDPA